MEKHVNTILRIRAFYRCDCCRMADRLVCPNYLDRTIIYVLKLCLKTTN